LIAVDEWFETRALLSHDVLKNRVMVAFDPGTHGSKSVASVVPYLELFVAREGDFRTFIKDTPIVLRPGSWLAGWMSSSLDVEAASVLSEFLNMDFERTSSLPGKCREIRELLEHILTAARQVLETQSNDVNGNTTDVEMLIQKLSDELTALPSTMLEVVETMR